MTTINYIVDETNQDFLDTNTASNVAYWIEDSGIAYTNEAHLNYINAAGGFGLDVAAFMTTLQADTVNINIETAPINNASQFYAFTERTTQIKTSATDYTYLELNVDIPDDGTYLVTYGMNIRYEKRGSQYIKYKVDVDNSVYVSNPANNGWVEPEVWLNESNSYKGLDWTNSRPLTLTAGAHTVRLKIGRTSNKKVIANYGFLSVEEK